MPLHCPTGGRRRDGAQLSLHAGNRRRRRPGARATGPDHTFCDTEADFEKAIPREERQSLEIPNDEGKGRGG